MQKNVLEYLERTLLQQGDRVAVIDERRRLTFKELSGYSSQLGRILTERVFKQPIAVFLPKSAESLVAFLGILYSGNFYIPIDVKSPSTRVKGILEDLGNPLVITNNDLYEDLLNSVNVSKEQLVQIETIFVNESKEVETAAPHRFQSLIDTDPVYIIYTSGSTGSPKGVVISHRSVIDYIDWALDCFNINNNEVIGNQSPFYFDNSTLDIYLCLAAGATLVIIPERYFAFPQKLIEYVTSQRINFIFWVPSVMINVANMKALERAENCGLNKILFAGEVMPNKQLNYWRAKLPNALYANLYGPTEITVDCTYYIVEKEFKDYEPLPIGFPCDNSEVLILNEMNQLAAENEPGELCVRGSSLALGYWHDFEKSAQVFVQNPLNNSYFDRVYRTGDMVYRNKEGEIVFIGRKDSQIKHMGYRIEIGEIETAVLGLASIHNACVIYNQPKSEITLFYEGDRGLTGKEIRLRLMEYLPKYMIPTKTHYVENLPLNSNGKIDRRRLARDYLGGNEGA